MSTVKFVVNKFSRKLPYSFAKSHKICVYGAHDQSIMIVCCATTSPMTISEVSRKLAGYTLITREISEQEFDELVTEAYSSSSAAAIVDDIQDDMDLNDLIHSLPQSADLLESENDAPIIKIINAFLTQAVKENASDVHIDAYENQSLVRFRVDGTLRNIAELNPGLHSALISRIKIMSQLDIAEKRLPQDGRIALKVAGREIDLRVSTIPTGHGERVVMRLLDKNRDRLRLETLGMEQHILEKVNGLVHSPHGIFLITGPTGSGKSTTLYAALARLDSTTLNIMTVEDPVEYDITGISQTQINARIDMSFARALRAILRQDPDVIMIGEIRDLETSQIAVQASLTGHLVLATLHTNTAASAITRLIDMGVESFLLSSTLIGVLAQRLVRLLCPACKAVNTLLGEIERQELHIPADAVIYSAVGCAACNDSGYKGRTGVHELLIVDNKIQEMIHTDKGEIEIERYAIEKAGMRTLHLDAIRLAIAGVTSIEEVRAVTKE